MPRDANGNYTLPVGAFAPQTLVKSADMNTQFNDIATALTGSLARAGGTMTGPLTLMAGDVTQSPYLKMGSLKYNCSIYTDSTLGGTQGGWGVTNQAVNAWNIRVLDDGKIQLRNTLTSLAGGFDITGNCTIRNTTAFLQFQSGSYGPRIQADSTSQCLGITNSANTQYHLQTFDADGKVLVPNYLEVSKFIKVWSGLWVQAQGISPGQGQGTYQMWNEAGAMGGISGGASWINNQGGGNGGFIWRNVNSNNTQQFGWMYLTGQAGDLHCSGAVYGTNMYAGSAQMAGDGNVNGSIWGGWLSNYLSGQFAAQVHRNSGNSIAIGWDGSAGNLNFYVDSTFVAYLHQNVSDETLKSEIMPVVADSVSLIKQINYFSYTIGEANIPMGVMAGQLKSIAPRWVYQPPDGPLSYDRDALLFDALNAIKQLEARIAVLENKNAPSS